MPIVNMKDMLQHAYSNGYAVGAFDLVSLNFLEGIMAAAEQARAPVILSLAESHFDYFDFELVMPAVEAAARRSAVPVAIHLDHGASVTSAVQAIRPITIRPDNSNRDRWNLGRIIQRLTKDLPGLRSRSLSRPFQP